MNFNKEIDTLFVDPSSESFTIEDKVNVILSPSLYWVKKVTLFVKSLRDVKSVLPSLFEDVLPDGTYSYSAYKSGEDYYIFAYEDKMILDLLESKGVSQEKINKVYFAQSELANEQEAYQISTTKSLVTKDGMVVVVPSLWVEKQGMLNLHDLSLSKHSIVLKKFSHIVNDKSLYTLGSVFIALILLVAIELFITTKKVSEKVAAKDKVFQEYSLKPTMMQNKAMLSEYKSLHKVQSKLSEATTQFLSLRLEKTQKISLMDFKNKKLLVVFTGIQNGKHTKIENLLKKKNIKFSATFKNDKWHVEVAL